MLKNMFKLFSVMFKGFKETEPERGEDINTRKEKLKGSIEMRKMKHQWKELHPD